MLQTHINPLRYPRWYSSRARSQVMTAVQSAYPDNQFHRRYRRPPNGDRIKLNAGHYGQEVPVKRLRDQSNPASGQPHNTADPVIVVGHY